MPSPFKWSILQERLCPHGVGQAVADAHHAFPQFGTGRFGHPEQDRAISVREAAMLQGFPRDYRFVEPGQKVHFTTLGRLIGNAVPPPLGQAIGEAMLDQAKANGHE